MVNLHRVREKRHEELLLREIKLLQEIKHPNLVGCLDALMTNNNCYIVTDYCEDGDFGVLLNRRGTSLSTQSVYQLTRHYLSYAT